MSWGTQLLAWLPALFVLVIPLWLVLRATESERGLATLLEELDTGLLPILSRTLGLAAAVTALSAMIALPLAWLTARTDLPLRRPFTVLLALPLSIPSYVGAFALLSAFGTGGPLAELFGIRPDLYGFWGATAALSLLGFPYLYLPLHAAFSGLDPRLEEASRALGRSSWSTFWSVSLPLVRPAFLGGVLMTVLYTLSDFGAVAMLHLDTFTRVIYIQHDSFNRPGAASLALVLVMLTLVIVTLELALRDRRRRLSSRQGRGSHTATPIPLGPWRWVATAFASLVVFVSLVAPVLVILWWGLAPGNVCKHCTPLSELAGNTLTVSALTALVAMLLVLPVARLATRGRSLFAHLPDRILYSGFAIPGIVIALALVFAGTRWVPSLYQTLPLLVLACVIRFIPQAADGLRPALEKVPPALEEAGRTLGARPARTFLRIALPIAWPGLLAGGALVFLTTLKELPATLVMRPTGWDTLATELWDMTNEGYFSEAAALGLTLIALGVVPMILIVVRQQRRAISPPEEP